MLGNCEGCGKKIDLGNMSGDQQSLGLCNECFEVFSVDVPEIEDVEVEEIKLTIG